MFSFEESEQLSISFNLTNPYLYCIWEEKMYTSLFWACPLLGHLQNKENHTFQQAIK